MSQFDSDPSVLQRAPMYSESEHFTPGLRVLSNDPSAKPEPEQFSYSNASEESGAGSGSEHTKEDPNDQFHPAREAPSAPTVTKEAVKMPHEVTRAQDVSEPLLMSWWPAPEKMSGSDSFNAPAKEDDNGEHQHEAKKRQGSVFGRLEKGFSSLLFGHHVHGHHGPTITGLNGGLLESSTRNAESKASKPTLESSTETDSLFHVVLTSSHFRKDVNSTVQGVRICGTFTSLKAAKSFAHRCLFDSGYEQEWFTTFRTQHGGELIDDKDGAIVQAVGPAGEVFEVSIATTPQLFNLESDDTHKVGIPLFYVVQTIVHYDSDESGQTRDTSIQGSYPSYDEARRVAMTLLLSDEDNITKDTYDEYDDAGPEELDCGYGENVLVHAIGGNGENVLVSVLKGQELESVRVAEAARRMRS